MMKTKKMILILMKVQIEIQVIYSQKKKWMKLSKIKIKK